MKTNKHSFTEFRATLYSAQLVIQLILSLLRLSQALSLMIHGLGHALMLVLVTGKTAYLNEKTISEGIGFSHLIQYILTGRRLKTAQIDNPLQSPLKTRLVAISGSAMNLLSTACVLNSAASLAAQIGADWGVFILYSGIFVFTVSSILATLSIPDLIALIRGNSVAWACGPAFAIRYKLGAEESAKAPLASDRLRDLIKILSTEASTRGGQSAGFAIMVKKQNARSIIFDKVVKGKREDIVKVLCSRLLDLLYKAEREGFVKVGGFEATMLHLRYATGGATHWDNAQPHWYEHYNNMMFHRIENGELVSQAGEVFNLIAHNGDMDAVHLQISVDGQVIRHSFSQSEARSIFQSVMPKSTSSGDSDSRSIAEWVDFLLTRGLAFKALRYAYITRALDFNQELVSGRFDLEQLHQWAEAIDLVILNSHHYPRQELFSDEPESIDQLSDQVKSAIRQQLKTQCKEVIPASRLETFLDAFEQAFYRQDLTWVMRQASRNLVGEFALMVCSTTEPRMGVFSLTQAFSIGHNISKGEIFGSAEPQGVTSSLHYGEEKDETVQINLLDGQYATVEFENQQDSDAILIYDRVQDGDDFSQPAKPSPACLCSQRSETGTLWFPVNNNPKIDRATRNDPAVTAIHRDLQDIPFVLRRVVDSFKSGGENQPTMAHLAQLLFDNLSDPERNSKKYDLVLYGVDFNQDLIREFTLALASVLPDLKVRAENSGNVLKEMKRTTREGIGGYGPKTVFLGVSNSAQTQSTLAAARKAVELVGGGRCFVLTQSFLNSMTQALNQGYQADDPVLPNTFINLSQFSPDGACGRRRSEAATIVPVATQAVLTEILLNLLERALQERPRLNQQQSSKHFEIRHDMQKADICAFREFQSAVYDVEIANRVGYNAAGEEIDSPDQAVIDQEAKERAENHIEFIRAYALFAAYIVFATLFGIPLFSVLSSPLQSLTGVGFIASVLDAALFLSALWLIHLAIRHIQGRPVFERMGARAELYIDRKYIARMVERYNATLFSNAPAFLTPFFYWADTVQDALHRFGIRAHRGVVTIHRTPDERMGIEEANNAAEENMVFAQIGGIRFNAGQPQSRDKVRDGSHFMNRTAADFIARPYQIVLSDSLKALREKYDEKLSPEALRLINRRLIDLSDGIVFEFVVGARRKQLINESLWDLIKWMPGANGIYRMMRHYGIDLQNILGDADTANQAQIQSTKHPVSPMDINIETLSPRPTVDALISQEKVAEDQNFAVVVFYEHCLSISLNEHAGPNPEINAAAEILLYPGKGKDRGKLISDADSPFNGQLTAILRRIKSQDHLLIHDQQREFQLAIPLASLDSKQQHYLTHQLKVSPTIDLSSAA